MRQLPGPPSNSAIATATAEGSAGEKDAAEKSGGRAEGNSGDLTMAGEAFRVQVTFCFGRGGLTMIQWESTIS